MTYLNDTKLVLDQYTSYNATLDKQRTFALAAQADEQRTTNLIALMNSSETSGADKIRIMRMVLVSLDVPTPEVENNLDEEED